MGRQGAWWRMSDRHPDERPALVPPTPWSADTGPEPAWADAIRRGRKTRGDLLRALFDTFGDDDPARVAPSRPADDEAEGS